MKTYKMECPYCYSPMIYIKNKKQEELGHICMKCEECKDLFLVPKENPQLEVINE
jgi:Zn-finger protein